MKFINKLIMLALVLGLSVSCDNLKLDLLDNPNAITPENASLNDLYNQVQLGFRDVYNSVQFQPGVAARMYHTGQNGTYEEWAQADLLNGLWNTIYAGFFPDVDAIVALAESTGFDVHAGSAKIMKAYALVALVDIFGNVPNSQALQGTDVISPASDPGDQVYGAAESLLDEAIAQLGGTKAAGPTYEGFYGGNADKWIKFANTIKLKMALNKKDVSTINSLVSGGNIITSAGDDFTFKYGNQRTNPNSRHPFYQSHYEAGDGDYLATYFMWLLAGDKQTADGVTITDPRINYYFYRKVEDAGAQDETTYGCHWSLGPDQSAKPAHWEATSSDVPYCIIPGTGYSGRDHLNPQGTPPDGPIKTSYGLYPGGGQFDDATFQDTRQSGTTGGLGQGIWPIMISPVVDLLRAEAALRLGTSDDARALLEKAIRASMAKVESFESLVSSTMSREEEIRGGGTSTVKELYGLSAEKVDRYVDNVLALYDAADADGKLDLVCKELMISAWGNGLEAYNMYRRTGKPNNIQPGLESNFGQFPRSFLYPNDHVTRNANVSQKALTDPVFWDDGTIDLY